MVLSEWNFLRVIVPLLKPVAATAVILVFMWSWNELQIPLYLFKFIYTIYSANVCL